MTIRSKLVLSFSAIMVLFAVNVIIYLISDSMRQGTFKEVLDAIERQKLITSISRTLETKIQEMGVLNSITADSEGAQPSAEQIQQFQAELVQIGRSIGTLVDLSTPTDRPDAEQLAELFDAVSRGWQTFYRNFGVDHTAAIIALAVEAEPRTPLLRRTVAELRSRQEQQVQTAGVRFAEIQERTRQITLGILALSLVLTVFIAGWISRHITGRLRELQEGTESIGEGRLDARIPVSSEDELGQLASRFNDMAERLQISRAKLEESTQQLRQQRDREQAYVAKLAGAMREVERGNYDQNLPVTGNDVWTGLYRGFNLMTEGLRDEAQILRVAQDLSRELKIDTLIEKIMLSMTRLLDADRSSLFLYDPKTNELWSRFAEGLQTQEIRFPASAGIAGTVFTSGKLLNVADPYSHPAFNPAMDRETGYKTDSILCMPITNKAGDCIGVTQVLNKRGGAFTRRDEDRLRALSSQVAVSLENAQLFEEVTNVKNYNESILQSSSNGLITLDTEQVVVTANDAALRILGVPKDAFLGRPAESLFQSDNSWVLESIAKVETTGQSDILVDAALNLPGGRAAAVNLTTAPLINAAEKSIGTLLILEDLTDEKRVKTTMARYMSAQVVDQLLEAGEGHLEGQTKHVTILFSDVRNFTNMAESMGARDTVTILNEYFEVMVDVIFRFDGILDKYIGDAIMALFGAPFEGRDDADHAVEAATGMLTALRRLNRDFAARGRAPLAVGIGIGTGEVVAGSIGSSKRMEYTVIGDSVNLASRLESANKYYGTGILLSEHTVRDLKGDHLIREIDLLQVKGKDRPVAVFEALGHHTQDSFPNLAETVNQFQQGLECYRNRDWDVAAAHFEAALQANPNDKPSQIYLMRCRTYASNPPPADWTGVWEMTTK